VAISWGTANPVSSSLGISTAKQEEQMKKTGKMAKNAEQVLQKVPDHDAGAAAGQGTASDAQSSGASSVNFSDDEFAEFGCGGSTTEPPQRGRKKT